MTKIFTYRNVSLILVVFGLLVSGYLSYIKLGDYIGEPVEIVCTKSGAFDCNAVQSSIYSVQFGIPIAWMGFTVYVLLGLMILLRNRIGFLRKYGLTMMFALSLFAWIYSMYLVYLQFFVIRALCQWCLMHEANMTILFITIVLWFFKSMNAEDEDQQIAEPA